LERRTLTPKSTIFILNVLGKTVAVAESANGITLLSELPSVKLQGDPGQVRGKEHEK
jgi:flagellar biogenesis protein FliO